MSGEAEAQRLERLAADVADLSEQVEQLTGRLDAAPDAEGGSGVDRDEVVELAAQVAEIEAGLKRLSEGTDQAHDHFAGEIGRLADLIAADTATPQAPAPAAAATAPAPAGGQGNADEAAPAAPGSWLDAEADEAEAISARVWDFAVNVAPHLHPSLELSYQCWDRHPAVVQALEDARWAWVQLYRPTERDTAAHAVLDWHLRAWPGLQKIINDDLRSCGYGKDDHKGPTRIQGMWHLDETEPGDYAAAARAWAAREGKPVRTVVPAAGAGGGAAGDPSPAAGGADGSGDAQGPVDPAAPTA